MSGIHEEKGFTLIELMIIIAIIGILAVIAVPAFEDYIIRARIAELMGTGHHAKILTTEYKLAQGYFPASEQDILLKQYSTNYVDTIQVRDGIITIIGNPTTLGLPKGSYFNITLRPELNEHSIKWGCHAEGAIEYAPAPCKRNA